MDNHLPADCTLLPLKRGELLVSAQHAVFCQVAPHERHSLQSALSGQAPLSSLKLGLQKKLEAHGFFSPPRPPKPDMPTVQIQLTNACNLACAYCCTNSGRRRGKEVGYEQLCRVVQQIPEALGAGTNVALLGGEPLLVPWALSLAAEVVKLGLPLTLFTNGTPLIDDYLAEQTAWLIKKGVLVRVSLSGPAPTVCDSIAGAERFELALAGIHKLAALGCPVTVDLMFMPQMVEALARDLPALRKRLPTGTRITFGVLYRSGREAGEHLFAGRAELDEALDRVAFETGESIPAASRRPLADRREGCGCAFGNHLHIRSDGALFNCFKMEEKIGHLEADNFTAAVQWSRDHPHRVDDLPTCAACPLRTLCGGGCRAENLLYTGNPDRPLCGPWRVRVLSELLAEERVTAVEWSVAFLLQEARRRGIEAPTDMAPSLPSRHMLDV
jgi:radical SAM protein with 4Fe4S-binding SPASM domain